MGDVSGAEAAFAQAQAAHEMARELQAKISAIPAPNQIDNHPEQMNPEP